MTPTSAVRALPATVAATTASVERSSTATPRSEPLLLVDGAAQKCRSVALDAERFSRWSAAGKRRLRARHAPRRAARRRGASDSRMRQRARRTAPSARRAPAARRPRAPRRRPSPAGRRAGRGGGSKRCAASSGTSPTAMAWPGARAVSTRRVETTTGSFLRAASATQVQAPPRRVRGPKHRRRACCQHRQGVVRVAPRVAPASARSGRASSSSRGRRRRGGSAARRAIKRASSQQLSWRPCSTTSSTTVCGEAGRSDLMAYSKRDAASARRRRRGASAQRARRRGGLATRRRDRAHHNRSRSGPAKSPRSRLSSLPARRSCPCLVVGSPNGRLSVPRRAAPGWACAWSVP